MKLTNQQLYQIEEYCWANYATVEGFLENLEWELRGGEKIAKIENKIITTTSGNEIRFGEII